MDLVATCCAGGIILVQETFYMQGWHTTGGAGPIHQVIYIIIIPQKIRGTTGFMDTTLVTWVVNIHIRLWCEFGFTFSVLSTVAATIGFTKHKCRSLGARHELYNPVTSARVESISHVIGSGVTGVTVYITDMVTGLSVGVGLLRKCIGQEVVYNDCLDTKCDGQHIDYPIL